MSRRGHAAAVTTGAARLSGGKKEEISLSPHDLALKRQIRALIQAVGGFEVAAEYSRLGKSQLQRCASENEPDFLPVDVMIALEEITCGHRDWPHLTRHSARHQHLALLSLPELEPASSDCLMSALAVASREHSDIASGLLDALKDGKPLAAAKRAELRREAIESAEAAMRLHALLGQTPGEP